MLRRSVLLLLILSLVPMAGALVAVRHKHTKQPRHASWWERRAFIPSRESLLQQNAEIDRLGLPRIKDDKELFSLIDENELVAITTNKFVAVSPKLDKKRRFVRAGPNLFLQELGEAYYDQFHEPIQVNSAVRTERVQRSLIRWNPNAAPVHGEIASSHLSGMTFDLQRRGLSLAQIRFLQKELLYFNKVGFVIVEEELREPCFHIMVTGEYPVPPPMPIIQEDPHGLDIIFANVGNEIPRYQPNRGVDQGDRDRQGTSSGSPCPSIPSLVGAGPREEFERHPVDRR